MQGSSGAAGGQDSSLSQQASACDLAMSGGQLGAMEDRPADFPFAASDSYREFFDRNPEAIFLLDDQGRVTHANLAAQRLCGYSQSELENMTCADLCADSSRTKAQFFFARAMAGMPRNVELAALCRDGVQIDVELSATPVRRNGVVVGLFCTVRDITRHNRIEAQLRRACHEAERAKDRFLAVLSHELRTPLMPVLTTVQMLESRGGLSDELRDMLAMMRRNLELEARLIDDLLDLNRMRDGKLSLYIQNTDIHAKIRHVLELCQNDIIDKQLRVRLELKATASQIGADPARVQQVLWNVIGNAVKFTPAGGTITLRTCNGQCSNEECCSAVKHCKVHGRGREQAQVLVVHVIDTGIGMEPRDLSRLFTAFEHPGRDGRNFGGAGIGLAISKALVELHGGELFAQSEGRGKGATFTILLPQRRVPAPQQEDPPAGQVLEHQSRQPQLLLVEDHSDTAKVLTHLLRSFGFHVSVAHSVHAAVALGCQKQFDLLVSDIGLPDGSGADVVRAIQRHYPIPAIALSGYGMEEDIARSRAAGFADHLVKPINLQQLQATINRLLLRD